MSETPVVPAELIEAALRKDMRIRPQERATAALKAGEPILVTGGEAEEGSRIALKALEDAGLVVVSAEDLRLVLDLGRAMASTVHIVTPEQHTDYVTAQARLRAALPERIENA